MIKVCDAIMGTGKTSAAINYFNDHSDEKFIFITPYLTETKRIKESCPDLNFTEPSDHMRKYHFKKSEHTKALIEHGKNISTTHQAFKMYTEETLNNIREQGYTLVIDENIAILDKYEIHPDDLRIAVDSGYIEEHQNSYTMTDKPYSGVVFKELLSLMKSRELMKLSDEDKKETYYYWTLPPELLTAFKDVYILTYLFEGQSLKYFMDIHKLPYTYIGIQKTDKGFEFGDYPGYTPEYVSHLKDMIHINEGIRINSIGDDYYSLSKSWFDKDDDIEQVKKNVTNYFLNIHGDIPADQRMWSVFKSSESMIRGKGYTKSFVTFNARATNEYRNRTCLVYLTNVFMNVFEKILYELNGAEVNQDLYALSVMIQWIWRSAIRDGEEIYIYVPSSRMRGLLINWIDDVSKGGVVNV